MPDRYTEHEENPARSDIVSWVRCYQGIELLNRSRSILIDGRHWETHHRRELKEPEPIRTAQLLPAPRAVEKAGMAGLDKVTARLVYKPEYKRIAKPQADAEIVIARYRLSVEVSHDRRELVWIDAYTGEVIEKDSPDQLPVHSLDGMRTQRRPHATFHRT